MRGFTSYALHLGKAKGPYGIHSPFVYELLQDVIRDRSPRPAYNAIEKAVEGLKKDTRRIGVNDLGAGSKWSHSSDRRVKDIACRSGCGQRYGRLLLRLAERFASSYAVELGTSLGIGTLYMATGSSGTVHSIEGCPSSGHIAQELLREQDVKNTQVHIAPFKEALPEVLGALPFIDLFRIDGDHRGRSMLHYFEQGLEKAHNDTLFILDDIHWSKDMEAAWQELQADERVTLTLDLYEAGLLFIRREQKDPIHLKIRF